MNSNGIAAAVAVDQDRLVQELSDSIRQFNLNRVPILKKAFQDLGDPGVAELEKEYDSLRDAYFEVVRRQLDVNNQRYAELAGATSNEAQALDQSITQLTNVASVIDGMGKVLAAVGKLVLIAGV